MLAVSVVLAVAPSLFLLVYFYLKDRYEPEPRGHVALAFLKGAVATLPALFLAPLLDTMRAQIWVDVGAWAAHLFEAVVQAGSLEEGCKWLIFATLIYRWDEFDEPLDGVVYGVALALGFATVENVCFVLNRGVAVGLLRALFAVPAHALFGAVMGFYFGEAKLGPGRHGRPAESGDWLLRLAFSLIAPILFHGAYDFSLLELNGMWSYFAVALLSVGLWLFVLRRVHRAQAASPFQYSENDVK